MEKIKYKKPVFDFQEMQIMEKVADVCWGQSHHAYFDADRDGKIDADEQCFYVKADSCNESMLKLKQLLIDANFIYITGSNKCDCEGKQFCDSDIAENVGKGAIIDVRS